MFTGIIEHFGTIESVTLGDAGGRVTIHAPTLAGSLAISNSVAVNGCCLTVVSLENGRFSADLSLETIRKTSFGASAAGIRQGSRVNLEQPLTAGKEFGGHFVLGHVDTIGRVTRLEPEGENWWYGVRVPADFASNVVPKGSITIDGISLTVARWSDNVAAVAVIPYTYEHTNIRDRKPGDAVNLEGDILGKYIERHLAARASAAGEGDSTLSMTRLVEEGF
ncbi:MAG TPA: riboflavin synthase [Candidatus Acidoferrum sp.]|jgi:riboflavin synthase